MHGLKNWFEVISMRLMCKGFIVLDCEYLVLILGTSRLTYDLLSYEPIWRSQ